MAPALENRAQRLQPCESGNLHVAAALRVNASNVVCLPGILPGCGLDPQSANDGGMGVLAFLGPKRRHLGRFLQNLQSQYFAAGRHSARGSLATRQTTTA
jgi:hypothetical protein